MSFWHIFFEPWMYSLILFLSLTGLAICDWHWRLVFWESSVAARAAATTIGCMIVGFIVWDIAGILLGVFYTNTRYTLGWQIILPNLPIEELVFLGLLSYCILVVWFGVQLWLKRSRSDSKSSNTKAIKSS